MLSLMPATVIVQIIAIYTAFSVILATDEVRNLARNNPGDFTRSGGKLPLPLLITYVIFRNCKDTDSELSNFFSKTEEGTKGRPTRQALNKRLRCLNANIWPYLSKKFSDLFYGSNALVRKLKNYCVWATDSSSLEMPPSEASEREYGKHKNNHSSKESSSGKVIVRCGGLYDVINRLFVDYIITPFKQSEMAIILSQIREFAYMLLKHKIIILADRGYASLQFMALMSKLGYKFCVRVTSSTYKSLVKAMKTNDEYIEIKITQSILSRITDSEALAYLSGMTAFRVRVVKKYYTNPKTGATEWMILFTNLPEDEFNTAEIFDLYGLRWNIEVAYYTLKVVLEAERHISLDPGIAINLLYGKIMFYNFSAIFREQLDLVITEEELRNEATGKKVNKYKYHTNVKSLINLLYSSNLIKCFTGEGDISVIVAALIENMVEKRNSLKTAIRPGRHYGRWGQPVTCSYKYKFKIDGRNHQRVAMVGGTMRTVKP